VLVYIEMSSCAGQIIGVILFLVGAFLMLLNWYTLPMEDVPDHIPGVGLGYGLLGIVSVFISPFVFYVSYQQNN